jgi:O-antigen/teichoic acid export membrane protein
MTGFACKVKMRQILMQPHKLVKTTDSETNLETKFLGILVVGKASYLFDPLLIGFQLASVQVGIASIYQKFLIGYSIIPQAISPIVMIESHKKDSQTSSQAKLYLYVATFFLTVFFLLSFRLIFEKLTHGAVTPSSPIFFILLMQGVIGSLVSYRIQKSVSASLMETQLKVQTLTTILGLITTFLLLPYFGIAVSFITSALSSTTVYLFLRIRSSRP